MEEENVTTAVETAVETPPETTPEAPAAEENLDNKIETDNIDTVEDKGSEEPFSLDSLFADLFGNEEPAKEPEPVTEVKPPVSDINIEELTSTIETLNNALSEKDATIDEKDTELNNLLDEVVPLREKLDNAEQVWAKLEENKPLYDLVIKHLGGEKVDLAALVENVLGDELDAINNSLGDSSDAEPPKGEASLQERMMNTVIRR